MAATDPDLRSAINEALYLAYTQPALDEVAAIEAADRACAALDGIFGAQRHYWRAPPKDSRNRQILADLQAGLPPDAVAAKHGVHRKTVEKIRASQRKQTDDAGLGREDWVIR